MLEKPNHLQAIYNNLFNSKVRNHLSSPSEVICPLEPCPPLKESNAAKTSPIFASITLFLFPFAWKSLSFSTAPRIPFYLDAAEVMDHWMKSIRSLKFTQLNFFLITPFIMLRTFAWFLYTRYLLGIVNNAAMNINVQISS